MQHLLLINACNETRKVNIDNGKKNYSEKQVYDGNAVKASAHNKQGCNIQMSLEHTQKRMKSAPFQILEIKLRQHPCVE